MRASLRAVYGLDLRQARDTMTVFDLADLVAWLPPGCAFWMDVGGPASLSVEARELREVEFRLRELQWIQAGGKKAGRRPEPPKEPPYAHERRAEASATVRKAEAFLRRQRAGTEH